MAARVLVVDDDQPIVDFYRDVLTEEGWIVDIGDLDQLVNDNVAVGTPDVILLDWMLGHQPAGDKVVQRLKADPATRQIPIVVCTVAASAIAAVEPELTAQGIPVLTKPFQVDDFLSLLHTVLHPSGSPMTTRSSV